MPQVTSAFYPETLKETGSVILKPTRAPVAIA